MQLRKYQRDAVEAVRTDWHQHQDVIGVAATGAGKTQIMLATLLGHEDISPLLQTGDRGLLIAHRDELIQQPLERVRSYWPEWIERTGVVKAALDENNQQLTIASVQSLHPKRLEKLLAYGKITHLLTDECHHAVADSYTRMYNALREANPELRSLGVTATPVRADKKGMIKRFSHVSFGITIKDLIRQGFLVPLRGLTVATQVDVSTVKKSQGDLAANELSSAFELDNVFDLVVATHLQHATGRKAIAFTVSVAGAHELAAAFCGAGIPAEALDGTTPKAERDAMLKRFACGKTMVLTNCAVLCLDDKTEILTSDGWIGIDEMTYQHEVANWEDGHVFFEPPKFIVRRQRKPDERMVFLETSRRSIRVTEDHRMLYRPRHSDKFSIIHAKNLVGVQGEIPISGYSAPLLIDIEQPPIPDDQKRNRALQANSYILRKSGMNPSDALVEAAQRFDDRHGMRYKRPNELTVEECKFIGFWIGDGTRTELQSGGIEYLLIQSLVYPNIIKWIDSILESMDVDYIKREYPERLDNGCVRWSLPRGTGFGIQKRRGLFHLEPYLNKDGSKLLWGLNQEQFDALVLGIWYADGDHGKAYSEPNSYRISSCNHTLLSILQAVACCRGYRASIRMSPRTHRPDNHSILYTLHLSQRDTHAMTKHTLQFETDWRDERVWCVTSTTGNIITRRNGTVTIVGNTEGFDQPDVAAVHMVRPTQNRSLFIQCVGRGLRTAPMKTDCLVLEYAPSAGHNLATLGDVLGYDKPKAQPNAEFGEVTDGLFFDGMQCIRINNGDPNALQTAQVDYLSVTELHWTQKAGWMIIGLGQARDGKSRIIAIAPPVVDKPFVLYGLTKEFTSYDWEVRRLMGSEDFSAIIERANEIVEQYAASSLTSKKAKWKQDGATEGQLKMIKFFVRGQDEKPDWPTLTKGAAGDLINFYQTKQALAKVGKWYEV